MKSSEESSVSQVIPKTGSTIAAREWFAAMAKTALKRKTIEEPETFGQRMAALREAAGYSQRALASELGISQRMVAYYESQSDRPPAHLLPALAGALGITTDQLLGMDPVSSRKRPKNTRLMRKLAQVEKLPPKARQAVIEHIEGLIARYGKE